MAQMQKALRISTLEMDGDQTICLNARGPQCREEINTWLYNKTKGYTYITIDS